MHKKLKLPLIVGRLSRNFVATQQFWANSISPSCVATSACCSYNHILFKNVYSEEAQIGTFSDSIVSLFIQFEFVYLRL